jgi:UDP-N-acetyl-2-amino-2-deoxyglucuronate dehydrogenase
MTDSPAGSSSFLRVAIVGSGIIGHNHAAAIQRHPRLRITALVDPSAEANDRLAASIQEATGMAPERFAELAAALDGGAVDLIVITSPSGTHAALAETALAAGAHVVVEKPIDASLPAARRLARLAAEAEKRGQLCSVISQHRFDPASVAVAHAVRTGAFGSVTSALASVPWWRGQDYYDSAGWRGTWRQDGGGATMNQGVHTLDLLLWLLGRPVEVSAQTGTLAHDRVEVEDVAVATLRFESGALAVLHATTAAYPGLPVRLQIHGSRGSAVIHDDQLEFFHAAGADGTAGAGANQAGAILPAAELRDAVKTDDAFVVGHLRQYHDIVDAISLGRPPEVDADQGMLAVAVVKAVYLSAHLNQPIAVDAVLDGAYDQAVASMEGEGSL